VEANVFNYIEHFNCKTCKTINCIKIFDKLEIKINNKDIYISYNILQLINYKDEQNKSYETLPFYGEYKFLDRLCYVEFNDMILIELEQFCVDYYINKLPVYSFDGKLLEPYMCNYNNKNLYQLNIDYEFINLFGIKNYFNPLSRNRQNDSKYTNQKIVDDINSDALIIIGYYFYCLVTDRYNILSELLNKLNKIGIITIIPFTKKLADRMKIKDKHNTLELDNIKKINFKINNKLYLNDKGYDYNKISKFSPEYTYNKLKNSFLCTYNYYKCNLTRKKTHRDTQGNLF
jgi:hypothetical protein